LGRPLAIDDIQGGVRLVLLGRVGSEERLRTRLWFKRKKNSQHGHFEGRSRKQKSIVENMTGGIYVRLHVTILN